MGCSVLLPLHASSIWWAASFLSGLVQMGQWHHVVLPRPVCVLLLQEKYLQGRKQRMQRILQDAAAVADAMAAAAQAPARSSRSSGSDSGSTPPLPAVEDPAGWGVGADGAVPSVSAFVKTLDERFINALQETIMNMNTIFLQVCAEHDMRGAGHFGVEQMDK